MHWWNAWFLIQMALWPFQSKWPSRIISIQMARMFMLIWLYIIIWNSRDLVVAVQMFAVISLWVLGKLLNPLNPSIGREQLNPRTALFIILAVCTQVWLIGFQILIGWGCFKRASQLRLVDAGGAWMKYICLGCVFYSLLCTLVCAFDRAWRMHWILTFLGKAEVIRYFWLTVFLG